MNSTDIFSIALGLVEPWFVKQIEFSDTALCLDRELHLHLDFKRGYKFPESMGGTSSAYDTVDHTWQHLNFFEHKCFLHARVPRIKHQDGTITQVQVPWARANSGFTLLFEAYAMLLIESEMPICKVSHCMKVTAPRIWRMFSYWVKRAIAKDDLSQVKQIGMDETSNKKGHNYVTLFADIQERRVVYVTQGKDSTTVDRFVETLEQKGGTSDNIELVSMDMSASFIKGVGENLPDSQIVFDKFHLVQSLNKALDEVRKLERKGNELLKGHKYTVLKKYENLSLAKKSELDHLLVSYPILGESYRLRELFMDMFTIADPEQAKGYLWFWCDMVTQAKIAPFQKFVAQIKSHWSGIVAYFDKQVTNGIMEGINSKVQLAKRRARGYRNIDNFINMIYFLTAKLKFDYPLDSL